MLNRGIYIEEISTKLAWIKAKVELCSSLNLLDSNIHMEYFLCGLLNTIYGYHLKNLNTIQSNYISIDLGDTEEKVAIKSPQIIAAQRLRRRFTSLSKTNMTSSLIAW